MQTSPPVVVNLPGDDGPGPIGRSFWTFFCTQAVAQEILVKVQGMAGATVTASLIDGAGPGGDYAAFGGQFQYLDQVTRMWQITGTIQPTAGGPTVNINEFAGALADRMAQPNIFEDKAPYPASGPVLHFEDVDPTDAQLFWGS
jgi:hypothetical protein